MQISPHQIQIDGSPMWEAIDSANLPRYRTARPGTDPGKGLDPGIQTSVRNFIRHYEARILELLSEIGSYESGAAILDGIQENPGRYHLRIVPCFVEYDKKTHFPRPLEDGFEPNAYASKDGANAFRFGWGSRRDADSSLIEFTPAHWARPSILQELGLATAPTGHAGSLPDEVLLHELTHAYFHLVGAPEKGWRGMRKEVPLQPSMKNFSEYFAVLVANIYRSERKRRGIRPTYKNDLMTTSELGEADWLERGYNKAHMRQLRRIAPELFNDLREVNAEWNPLRGFDAASGGRVRRVRRRIRRGSGGLR